jgi:ADP-heptose:LPS heptosyltransferase
VTPIVRRPRHVVVVRLDSMGDVLVCGPAVRAVAEHADRVSMLVSQRGAQAAKLLPGVDCVLVWDCPWITYPPPRVVSGDVLRVVRGIARARITEALILTSHHQSALPTALLLQMAGVQRIHAVSRDFPGTLLTSRLAEPGDAAEPLRMLALARAAGFAPAPGDDHRLAIKDPGAAPADLPPRFVAVHPGADAPARAYPLRLWREVVAQLRARGREVVVTGTAEETALGAELRPALSLCGRTDLPALAAALGRADALVAGNTGPAHLAAAVGTPVVSLFAPVVPAVRWAPYGVPTVVLGDQDAPCRGTRVRECVVPGHPCLSTVAPSEVVEAVDTLAPVGVAA